MRSLALALALAACSSDPKACPFAVDALYANVTTSQTGDCPASTSTEIDAVQTNPDGTLDVSIQGLPGSCSGKLNGCTWTASCVLGGNAELGTAMFSWTFTDTGFSGTTAVAVPPNAKAPNGCQATLQVMGTRTK